MSRSGGAKETPSASRAILSTSASGASISIAALFQSPTPSGSLTLIVQVHEDEGQQVTK